MSGSSSNGQFSPAQCLLTMFEAYLERCNRYLQAVHSQDDGEAGSAAKTAKNGKKERKKQEMDERLDAFVAHSCSLHISFLASFQLLLNASSASAPASHPLSYADLAVCYVFILSSITGCNHLEACGSISGSSSFSLSRWWKSRHTPASPYLRQQPCTVAVALEDAANTFFSPPAAKEGLTRVFGDCFKKRDLQGMLTRAVNTPPPGVSITTDQVKSMIDWISDGSMDAMFIRLFGCGVGDAADAERAAWEGVLGLTAGTLLNYSGRGGARRQQTQNHPVLLPPLLSFAEQDSLERFVASMDVKRMKHLLYVRNGGAASAIAESETVPELFEQDAETGILTYVKEGDLSSEEAFIFDEINGWRVPLPSHLLGGGRVVAKLPEGSMKNLDKRIEHAILDSSIDCALVVGTDYCPSGAQLPQSSYCAMYSGIASCILQVCIACHPFA